jgi:hypothetical protein
VIRGFFFYLLSAVLVLSALGLVLEAVFTSGVYGCAPPLSLVLMPPLGLSGLLCLALAANRGERVSVAVVLGVGAIASVRLLTLPFGYRIPYENGAIGDVRTVISAEAAYESANVRTAQVAVSRSCVRVSGTVGEAWAGPSRRLAPSLPG